MLQLRELNLAWRRTNKSLMQSKNYINNFFCKNKQYYKREEITRRWQRGEYRGRVRPVNLHKVRHISGGTL